MGWYGGQDGAARLRWRDQSRAALNRFRSSVRNSKMTSFYDKVDDNHDREVSSMFVRNPMTQEELVAAVLEEAPPGDDDGGWAVAIAVSESLTDLSLLNGVADRITGLFLYGCRKCDAAKTADFLSRLVNLESLTLVACSPPGMFGINNPAQDNLLLKTAFAGGMLPKLKFLETDAATDNLIAEMSTCPGLARLVLSYPSASVTNEGIQRLVDAGGAKELLNISAGTLKKHLSKTLTQKYVAATLPKLVGMPEHQAFQYLSHMARGAKKKSALERLQAKHAAEDSKPFAVVPPERMTHGQLQDALKRRGVSAVARQRTEEMRSMFTSGQVEWTHDQELAFQNRAKLEHLEKELERLRQDAASTDGTVAKFTNGKLGKKASKLYPLLGAYEIDWALRKADVRIPKGASKRRDDRAQLLHDSGYQGGGKVEEQLAHYRKVSAERHEKVAEKQGEIRMLRQEIASRAYVRAGGGANASKRTFQEIS